MYSLSGICQGDHCLVAVSEPPVEAISSKLSNTASYCLRTEWTAATCTVHCIGHSGFSVVNDLYSNVAMLQKMVLNVPESLNRCPNSWAHCSASRTNEAAQVACVIKLSVVVLV